MSEVIASTEQDEKFLADVRRIADDVAAAEAGEVDREARFPSATVDALRETGALGAFVPPELGGPGVSFKAIATACFDLGRRCGASGMVFAMHQIQVVTIVRHLEGSEWFADYLRRLVDEQRLIASVTSEVGTGGDLGRSVAAVTPGDDGMCSFEKNAPTVSYGMYADDLLTTLRRTPTAEPGDQVLVLTTKDGTELEQTGTWDPLGMRGTCSPGFVVRGSFTPEQILPIPFPQISAESMVPVSHILWAHVWLGIATDAFDRARSFVRELARRGGSGPPPAAGRLSHVMCDLSLMRSEVSAVLAAYEEMSEEPGRERLSTIQSALRFNNLKIAASEAAGRISQSSMGICGIVGFKNDSPYSIGRHLRDSMSAPLMVANERIHATNASLLLIAKDV